MPKLLQAASRRLEELFLPDGILQVVGVLNGYFPFVFRSARITAVHVRRGRIGKGVDRLFGGGR